ncbi:hypothetical protein DTO013E5_2091 [Penicillium roqueforti]|uniref:uncharacterized protein n=1 Tax=Penicillium roqueforti TaxID=5082 RepID=UPI00190D74F7|nr:uncharacterized protein LCP9604111_1379 [Penicillium roqueforti]KAF9253853.1 hypothetical protein LCP9604111_1379 [Penicillium roqueforti]KAI1835479.1 hypothetical protein CBS147337_3502 [Penicillium roqueforti]KAI2672192.1 hypothetical protein CBS147355_8344 [Penicillium roqueforti]KAI2687284.1 hypothetical protein LCP963914a_3885 [Penicillium roqueforti]KAI2706464.1 hypothetical protein CBS147372_375 [Penicillium roqueforti]
MKNSDRRNVPGCCPLCDKTQPAGIQCPTIVALDVANTGGIQALSSQPSSAVTAPTVTPASVPLPHATRVS